MTDITTPWTPTPVTRRVRTSRRVPAIARRPRTAPPTTPRIDQQPQPFRRAIQRARRSVARLAPGTSPSDRALAYVGHLERHPR